MHVSHSTIRRPERRTTPRSITARNDAARQLGHHAFADKRINGPTNVCYQHIIDCCGTHTYTRAKLETLAARIPGRSKELDGHKSVSSVKNYVRALVKAELVWLDELGIHVTGLEPKPAPIATQQPLPDLDEPRTLEMIANDIKAATDRGDFATVAQLAAEANAMRDQGAADSPAEPNEAASGADVSSVDESKNCPDLVKKLPRVKRQVNPSVVSQQNLLNPRQSASAACRPGGGGKDRQQKKQSLEIPNTEAARLLQAHGLKDARTIIECSAAPLDVIKGAYARRLEVNGGPGLEVKVIREGRWKTCGKRVDNLLIMPALDDEDAWREHYIGGPLGHYVIGGPTDAHLIWTTPHRPSRNSTATTPSICSAMVGCRLQCVPTLRRRTSRHRTTIRNW